MPCFYCGKQISLVRRLADADFCSEDHRNKYHDLTRMALNRLVETRDHLAAASPTRKRPRSLVAVEEPPERLPPLAEWLEERVAVPVGEQSARHDCIAPPAGGIQLPGGPTASLQPGLSAGLPKPYQMPGLVRALEHQRITSARGGAFLRPSSGRTQWMQGLGRPFAVSQRGLPEQPPVRSWEAEAAENVGNASLPYDARLPASRVLLPAASFPRRVGRSSCEQLLDVPAKLVFDPAATGPVQAAACPLGKGATCLTAAAWTPRPAGLETGVSAWRIPTQSSLLSMFVAAPQLPPRSGAMVVEARVTAPALFELRLPEIARPSRLPLASVFGSRPPVHSPPAAGNRLAGVMLMSSSVTAVRAWRHRPLASLSECACGTLDPLTPVRPRGASLSAGGWRIPPGLARVALQPAAGWPLTTVGFEAGQTHDATPPGVGEALPLAAPALRHLLSAFTVATRAFTAPAVARLPAETEFAPRRGLPTAPERRLGDALSISSTACLPRLAHVFPRAHAATLPKAPVPHCTVAPPLVVGCRVGLEPLLPVEEPALAASGAGWAALPSGWGVSMHPSWAGRLRPLEVEAARVAAPPAADEPLLVWIPEARPVLGCPATGPLPKWRPLVANLPRVDLHLKVQPLEAVSLAAVLGPGVQTAAALAGPRLAEAPAFPIGKPLYVGWAAMRLRRAPSSGGPVELGLGAACPVPAGAREVPAPGFRIVAWAFTHAPGIPRSVALGGAGLLPALGARPSDQWCFYARGLDSVLVRPLASVPPTWTAGLTTGALALGAAPAATLAEMRPATARSAARLALAGAWRASAPSWPALPASAQALPGPVTWEAAPRADPPELNSQAPPALPHRFDWAELAPESGCVGAAAGEAYAPLAHLLNAWQHGMAEVRELSVRLPRDRKAIGAVAIGRLGSAPPVLTAAAPKGTVCSPVRSLDWHRLDPSWAKGAAVLPSLPPVHWASADLRTARVPEPARCAPSGLRETSAGVRGPAMVWPRFDGVPERRLLEWAPLGPPVRILERDWAAAHKARREATVATGPPLAPALPDPSLKTIVGGLQAAAPHAQEGRTRDVPMTLRHPPERAPGLSGLGMPASAGVAACAFDLSWPWTAEIEPVSRNQTNVLRNQPRLAPIQPSLILQARPCAPIRHRFEPLPLETGLSLGRLFKRMPGLMLVHLISVVVLVLVGLVLWQTGAAASLRDRVRQRAAILLNEDFSAGMRRWTDGAQGWVRSPAGFMQVGSLALWNPSVRLTNYRVEFMGEIERQSLAWVFRARDPGNYYAMRIAVLKPGPLPAMALERFETVDGKPGRRTQVPLRVVLHNNAPFRVQVRISENEFTTFINDQIVDYWRDTRFPSGGVGFFNEPGARARLYWVKATHQDDLMGKLCAYFAPSSVDSNNGS